MTDVVDHGFIRSVYFTDPNGSPSKRPVGSSTPPGVNRLRRHRPVLRPRSGACRPRVAGHGSGGIYTSHPTGLRRPLYEGFVAEQKRQVPDRSEAVGVLGTNPSGSL